MTKGAIISYDVSSPIPKVILFQYNPDSLTRNLEAQAVEGEAARSEAFRLKGPPKETISLDIELDATDKLENHDENSVAVNMGIHPQLAALELMLYPRSSFVIANAELAAMGTMEIVPPEGPFTVFIWGEKRVLPVRMTSFSVEEEAYDANLNPIRAKVSLALQVLSYADVSRTHPGYSMFLAHHISKEIMADISGETASSEEGAGLF